MPFLIKSTACKIFFFQSEENLISFKKKSQVKNNLNINESIKKLIWNYFEFSQII